MEKPTDWKAEIRQARREMAASRAQIEASKRGRVVVPPQAAQAQGPGLLVAQTRASRLPVSRGGRSA